jgi:hypothetical protein
MLVAYSLDMPDGSIHEFALYYKVFKSITFAPTQCILEWIRLIQQFFPSDLEVCNCAFIFAIGDAIIL